MKKYIFIITALLLVSCERFLVEKPKSEQSLDQFFQSAGEGRSFVNTLYKSGATGFYDPGGFTGSIAMMGGYISGLFDNEAKGERIEPLRAQNLSFNAQNMSEYLDRWWSSAYSAIATANTAIRYIPNIPGISDIEKNKLLAEAKFFRAFNYFFLAKNFGGVPLIKEPYFNIEGIYVERVQIGEVYNLIVEDLEWAVNQGNLSDNNFVTNNFRITKGAASALLADVYLQMSGYPLHEESNYAKAAAVAKSIINNGSYQLIQNGALPEKSAYNTMRTSDKESEYVFSIEFDPVIYGVSSPSVSLPGSIRPPGLKYSRTYNAYRPTDQYIALYDETKDLRVQNQQLFFKSVDVQGVHFEFGEYAPYLFYDTVALYQTARGGQDMRVYRYAEVLLIAAEAIAFTEGVTQEAVKYLTDVRARAYWNTSRNVIEDQLLGLNKEAFIKEVWKERYRELALDYRLWSDIQRTRLYPVGSAGGNVNFVNVVGHTNPWGATYKEHHLLYPISDNELQRNPKLEQNPGY